MAAEAQLPVGSPPRPSEAIERTRHVTVAVIGNPNTGKSTVFNGLTGLRQKVGNYPGVTVEKHTGWCRSGRVSMQLVDLPGTYSLAANSPDEMIAVDVMLGRTDDLPRPDAILVIADASNLERNLYLASQVMELGMPLVIALNMLDEAVARGLSIDPGELSHRLGVPVVGTVARRGQGLDRLRRILALTALGGGRRSPDPPRLPQPLAGEIDELHAWLAQRGESLHHVEVERAIIDREGAAERRIAKRAVDGFSNRLERARERASDGRALASLEAAARYGWIQQRLDGLVTRPEAAAAAFTGRLDRILTHRVLGVLIFLALMVVVFQAIFSWATPLMQEMEAAVARVSAAVGSALPEGALQSLVADGVIAGVGSVVVFLPQILLLFFFIGLLEDCGYMARAAFLMDRLMVKVGLSGKSFIPLASSFACAVPGIMATRTIEGRRDRIATMMVAPLLTCSARLPVYALLIAAFVPAERYAGGLIGVQGLVLLGLYLLGIAVAVAAALVLKRTALRGGTAPFLMELPSYKLPSLAGMARRLFDRGRVFVVRVGTIVLGVTVVIWALAYFPHPASVADRYEAERQSVSASLPADAREQAVAEIDNAEAAAYLEQSVFGRLGHAVEPVFRPLGWNWQVSLGVMASFPAREVLISTLGTTYATGADVDEESQDLRQKLSAATFPDGHKVFTIPMVLGLLTFVALCLQCVATVGTLRKEANSWRWAGLAWLYMTALAYIGALIVFQLGGLIG